MATEASKKAVLGDLGSGTGRLTAADERLHASPPDAADWAETAWWSFTTDEGRAGGWLYLTVRPMVGVAAVGLWVWDAGSDLPWRLPFKRQYHYVPLAGAGDLDDLTLTVGDGMIRLVCAEPFRAHELSVEVEGLTLGLRFDARCDPHPVGNSGTTGHIDQLLWARGSLQLADGRILIDGPGCRDRSWGNRPESTPRQKASYSWGVAETAGFHGFVVHGSDGVTPLIGTATFSRGRTDTAVPAFGRRVLERSADRRPVAIELELDGPEGPTIASGLVVGGGTLEPLPGLMTWVSLVRWDIGGESFLGEDHEVWPLGALATASRTRGERDEWGVVLS